MIKNTNQPEEFMTITVLSGPDREKNYGDCFLIDDDSTLYVYDCGSEELANNVIDYMNQKGCSKAIAILSHNDADHFNGIKFLVDKGKISAVYTVCLLKYVDEILELCDGRKTENSVRKQILDRYDNIAQLGGYLIDIYPLNQKLSENISIVGPEKNYMLKAVAHELNSLEGDTIDNETVVNATSVQVEITFNDNKKILLCGDCSFEAVENKINNYNIIQLPHHGKERQAKLIFEAVTDINNKMFIVSDNTGPTNGGSDGRHFIGKNVKNTKSDGTFKIDETTLKSRTDYAPGKSLGI